MEGTEGMDLTLAIGIDAVLYALLQFGCDVAGFVAAFLMAEFYGRRRDQEALFVLFWVFRILLFVYFIIILSDLMQMTGVDAGIFTDPLGRAAMFRGPLTLVMIWAVHRSYSGWYNRDS